MIKKYKDIQPAVDFLRDKGNPRGEDTGFKCLDELYSIKQGSFTMIHAAPHNGKSEFAFELVFNQAERYGKKCLIYSPETGSAEDILFEFIHKRNRQTAYKSSYSHCSDSQYHDAIAFVDYYFSIVDSDEKAYSFEELTKLVTDEDIILCDPYNELHHDMKSQRQDLYVEDLLGQIRRYSKKNNKHCIMTLHPGKQELVKDKNGSFFYDMPKAREAAGGQANLRKAMTWINLWLGRGKTDDNGIPYADNEVIVQIEKAKPKGVANRGECSLFLDKSKSRYYEKQDNASLFAFQHEKRKTDEAKLPPLVQSDTCDF